MDTIAERAEASGQRGPQCQSPCTTSRAAQRADHAMNVGDRLAGATPTSVIVPPRERVISTERSAAAPIAKVWPARSRRSRAAALNPTIRSLPEP